MPPRTISSAVALIGLSTLTAMEAGGFSNHTESLRSASRAGLLLMDQAMGQASAASSYDLADYGVLPIAGLHHVCGHYELGPNGELTTYDLFTGQMVKERLEQALERSRPLVQNQRKSRHSVSLVVKDYSETAVPKTCRSRLSANPKSLLIASRVL